MRGLRGIQDHLEVAMKHLNPNTIDTTLDMIQQAIDDIEKYIREVEYV